MRRWNKGRFRQRKNGDGLNRTEQAYADYLRVRQAAGEVHCFGYEILTFKLADDTRYTPDFVVQMADGSMEIHEVKACRANGAFLIEDDANVKWKVAAQQFSFFTFRLCGSLPKKSGGGWRVKTYGE